MVTALGPASDALAHECAACGARYYGAGAALGCCAWRLEGSA